MIGRPKKAWLRVVEVIAAILILTGVVSVMYQKPVSYVSNAELVSDIQTRILNDISLNDSLRKEVLRDNNPANLVINNFVNQSLLSAGISSLDYEVKICDLNANSCSFSRVSETINKEVFVEEKIISSDLTTYSPKKIRLFMWAR